MWRLPRHMNPYFVSPPYQSLWLQDGCKECYNAHLLLAHTSFTGRLMEQLKKALQQHGIDAASLDILVEESNERSYLLTTSGADAVSLWHKFRSLINDIRYWPVIFGTDLSLWNLRRRLEELRHIPAQDIIARGLQIDPITWLVQRAELDHYPDDQWFAARLEHIRTAMNNHLRSLGYADDEMWDPWQMENEVPTNPLLRQPHTFAIPTEIVSTAPEADQASNNLLPWQPWHVQTRARRPAAKVHLGLLPTTSGWHIPALLKS